MPEEIRDVNDGFVFDMFLSHSSLDEYFVRLVPERWRKEGLKAWFDEWVLKPGDSIPARIEDGLEHLRMLALRMTAGRFRFRDPLKQVPRLIPLRLDNAHIKGSLVQFLNE